MLRFVIAASVAFLCMICAARPSCSPHRHYDPCVLLPDHAKTITPMRRTKRGQAVQHRSRKYNNAKNMHL